ncbi:B box and SPRY domain-containing protein [Hirundo rustica]|uniref:B box and SPRY domain-containing protein n=1 Tax=Hirundo rustica TaxID=43150 RepID=UPI001A942404|nr:B box and SPRY domain-containing protein [Hirundo rustica]
MARAERLRVSAGTRPGPAEGTRGWGAEGPGGSGEFRRDGGSGRAGGPHPSPRRSVSQNKLVERCERLQLQSAAIARHVDEVLPAKDQGVLSAASAARELVIQRLLLVGKACENEEQRLLERVHAEEERAHQSILTQQVHWTEALHKLDALRTYLVDMITKLDDQGLLQAEQEIFERTEVAEGILEPQESLKLNFNQTCVQSPLLHRLWACAVLCCLTGSQEVHIDEKTLSPHLSLSEDKRTLTFSPKKAKVDSDCPERFDHWPNALATAPFHSGVCAWKVSVEQSCAYKLGVCYSSVPRKGSANEGRLGFNTASWVFSRYDKEFRFLHAGQPQPVELIKAPAEIGVLLDFAGGELLFYDPDSCAILFSHRQAFLEPVYPVFAVAHQSISLVL